MGTIACNGLPPRGSASPCDHSCPSLTHNPPDTHSFHPPHLVGQSFTVPMGGGTQGLGCREAITICSPRELWGEVSLSRGLLAIIRAHP